MSASPQKMYTATPSTIPINPVPQTYVIPPPPRDLLVGPVVHLLLCSISFILFVLTLFLPVFHSSQYKSPVYNNRNVESSVTPWKTTIRVEGGTTITTDVKDYCWPVARRTRVFEAFACATAAAGLVSVIFGGLNVHTKGLKKKVITACSASAVITFVFAVIACAFTFSVYYWSFADCGDQSSFHSQLYEPSYGMGFIVTGWVLTFFAGLIVANDVSIPLDARAIDSAIFLFTLFSFIGTLFSCVSCPIPQWFYKDSATKKATDVSLWKTTTGKFDWDLTSNTTTVTTWRTDYTCSEVSTMFTIASCMSIVGTAFNFVATIWGVLLWQCLTTHMVQAIFFSGAGCLLNAVQFILETVIFYNTWCNEAYAYKKQKFVLGPGYALCATSFCVMLISSCLIWIALYGITKYFPSKLTRIPNPEKKEV